MSRGGQARCRPIPSPQDLCEAVGSPFAKPHFDHCSNYRADHVLEKPVSVGLNVNMVVVADDSESLQMADGIRIVCEASFKGGEVPCTDQCHCRLLHSGLIQRPIDVPHECAIHSGAGWTMEDPIGVELASRIVSGMKVIVHEGGGTNGNVFRQHGIERPHPA